MTPVVICLSRSGEATARGVATALGAVVHGRAGRVDHADAFFANAMAHIRTLFAARTPIIGVCASGILIRAVAPLLADKRSEPPVVAVAEDGLVVVPLLGGHHGANRLARRIAAALGGHAAVTTAGDVALGVALDEPPPGWRLANPEDAKPVMAALLGGAELRIEGDLPWLADGLMQLAPSLFPAGRGDAGSAVVRLTATTKPVVGNASHLVFHPQQ
ncbi:MAG: precorrin-3B C(17)-methyltransferase, partial [Hyphomicrobiales bacterium]